MYVAYDPPEGNTQYDRMRLHTSCETCTECKRCGAPKDGTAGGYGGGGGGGGQWGGGGGGGGGGNFRPGDWMCSSCNNHNFASRTECKRCGAPKDGTAGGYGSGGGGGGAGAGGQWSGGGGYYSGGGWGK